MCSDIGIYTQGLVSGFPVSKSWRPEQSQDSINTTCGKDIREADITPCVSLPDTTQYHYM